MFGNPDRSSQLSVAADSNRQSGHNPTDERLWSATGLCVAWSGLPPIRKGPDFDDCADRAGNRRRRRLKTGTADKHPIDVTHFSNKR